MRLKVLEASAGTGKTHQLVEQVMDLLREGLPLSGILVITFTNKAAEELKVRIRRRLRELSAVEGGSVFMGALQNFDMARISTIHAFFQGVLGDQAFETGRVFKGERTRGILMTSRAVEGLLQDAEASEPAIAACLQAWCCDLEKKPEDLAGFLHELRGAGSHLAPLWSPAPFSQALVRVQEGGLQDWQSHLERNGVHAQDRRIMLETLEPVLAASPGGCVEAAALACAGADLGKAVLKSAKLRCKGGALPDAALTHRLAQLRVLWQACRSLESVIASIMLPRIDGRIRQERALTGAFDHDDLIRDVQELLGSSRGEAMVRSLRARYQAALVDEFQDTDSVQWELLRRVFLEDGSRRLYVIGDPKQAIYSFRGADVAAYQLALGQMRSKGAQFIPLKRNHRSSARLVEAVNLLTDPSGESHILPLDDGIGHDSRVEAAKGDLDFKDSAGNPHPPLVITPLEFVDGVSVKVGVWRRALARKLAADIAALLAPVSLVAPSDILVLAANRKELSIVSEELALLGVPHALDSKDSVLESEEAGHWLILLRAIEDPSDSPARLRAWLSPFFGLKPWELTAAESAGEGQELFGRLRHWADLGSGGDINLLVADILERSGILLRCLWNDRTPRALVNFRHVGALLASMGTTVTQIRRGLELSRLEGSGDDATEKTCAAEQSVRLMTVHASKGLEAPVVFLYGGVGSATSKGATRIFHSGSQRVVWVRGGEDEGEMIKAQEESFRETCRLAYVALTRAKWRLHLYTVPLNFERGFMVPIIRRLEALRGQLGGLAELHPLRVDSWSSKVDPPSIRRLPATADPKTVECVSSAVAASQRWHWPRPPRRHSYTSLRSRGGDDGDVVIDEVPHEPSQGPAGKEYGIYFHALMEHGSFDQLSSGSTEVLGLARALASMQGLGEEAVTLALECAQRVLTMPLKDETIHLPKGLVSLSEMAKEWEFLYPVPGGSMMKGIADLVFRHEGKAYVLDWKTDSVGAAELRARVDGHYAEQAKIYSLALARHLGFHDAEAYEKGFGGALYVFVRHPLDVGVVPVRFSRGELEAFMDSVGGGHGS